MKRKRILMAVIAMLLVVGLLSASAFAAISDGISYDISNHWAKSPLATMVQARIIAGSGNTISANPDAFAPRQECIYMAVTYFGHTGTTTLSFTDSNQINPNFTVSVQTAVAKGIVNGYPDGSLKPRSSISRAEACMIVVKASGRTVITGIAPRFADTTPTWAADIVGYAQSIGLVHGYPDGTFQAERAVSRAEFAQMLCNIAALPPDSTAITPIVPPIPEPPAAPPVIPNSGNPPAIPDPGAGNPANPTNPPAIPDPGTGTVPTPTNPPAIPDPGTGTVPTPTNPPAIPDPGTGTASIPNPTGPPPIPDPGTGTVAIAPSIPAPPPIPDPDGTTVPPIPVP